MYYCLSREDYPNYDIAFDLEKISNKEEVGKEIDDTLSYMINCLEECNVDYDYCGIIPYIGLFINEKDLIRLDNCKNIRSKRHWSLSSIDILDKYVCLNVGYLFYNKDGNVKQFLSKKIIPKYFIIKYSDLLTCFNYFRYKIINKPKNFNELKNNFIWDRTEVRTDRMSDDPEIIYEKPKEKYDTILYGFKKKALKHE